MQMTAMLPSISTILFIVAVAAATLITAEALQFGVMTNKNIIQQSSNFALSSSSSSTTADSGGAPPTTDSKSYLYDPVERDDHYQGNIAQYLLDLNEECATLNFCGGMMFQLVLTNKLKSHLQSIASSSSKQPIIHPQSQSLLARIPNYTKSSNANNISIFHGRELRGIQGANGGMGFVLQLSYADPEGVEVEDEGELSAGKGADAAWSGKAADPQGWSIEEITTYDGWRSDQFRKWRTADTYQSEGFTTFITDFNNAQKGYGLNHRFYLHFDKQNRMWLCAEDGCEGTPVEYGGSLLNKLGGMFGFGK